MRRYTIKIMFKVFVELTSNDLAISIGSASEISGESTSPPAWAAKLA